MVGCAWSTTVPPKITCRDPAFPNRMVVLKLWLLSEQSVSHCILYWPWHTCWYKWSQQQWARYSNQEWITHSELHSDKCTNSNHRWSVWNKLSTLTLYILIYNISVGEWRAAITSFCSFYNKSLPSPDSSINFKIWKGKDWFLCSRTHGDYPVNAAAMASA